MVDDLRGWIVMGGRNGNIDYVFVPDIRSGEKPCAGKDYRTLLDKLAARANGRKIKILFLYNPNDPELRENGCREIVGVEVEGVLVTHRLRVRSHIQTSIFKYRNALLEQSQSDEAVN